MAEASLYFPDDERVFLQMAAQLLSGLPQQYDGKSDAAIAQRVCELAQELRLATTRNKPNPSASSSRAGMGMGMVMPASGTPTPR